MSELVSKQYRKIINLRNEGLHKYNSLFPHEFARIPTVHTRPHLFTDRVNRSRIHEIGLRHYDIGSHICVLNRPVPWVIGQKLIKDDDTVLDIGSSDGMFYKFLRFTHVAPRYSGLEIDETVSSDTPVYRKMSDIDSSFQVVTMFHVIEHMTSAQFLELMTDLLRVLDPRGTLIIATPNILCPGVFERDIEHRQPYPWYDLYAILRLFFSNVEVRRGHYLSTPLRMASIPIRVVLGILTEQDWCEEVVFVARGGHRPIEG
jgi:SAM-dependent methyltransferase